MKNNKNNNNIEYNWDNIATDCIERTFLKKQDFDADIKGIDAALSRIRWELYQIENEISTVRLQVKYENKSEDLTRRV